MIELPIPTLFHLKQNPDKQTLSQSTNQNYIHYSPTLQMDHFEHILRKQWANQVDMDCSSLLEYRNKLMDVVRVLTFIELDLALENEVKKLFDRYNVHLRIDENKKLAEDFIQKNSNAIQEFQNMLLLDVFSIIDHSEEIKEKENKKSILRNFIKNLDNNYWICFYAQTDTLQKIDLMQEMNEKLIKLLSIANISDHLALLFMELAQNAEKAHYEYIAKKLLDVEKTELFIQKKENRDKIKEIIEKNNLFIELQALFENTEDYLKLTILLKNKGLLNTELQDTLNAKMDKEHSNRSIIDFYEESDQALGAGLGLFYASYLKEESEKQGLIFDAFIHSDYSQSTVIASLELII